jgi:hypothetical protein
MTSNKTSIPRFLLGCAVLVLSGCLTTVPENGVCGLSTLSGQYAFPVRAGLAYEAADSGGQWVVWLWDIFDGGGTDTSMIAEDWGSYCTAITNAGFSTGMRPPQRTLVLTLAPPLAGGHTGPAMGGAAGMSASYYEQGDLGGVPATTSSFDVTVTTQCVSGPLQLTFPDAGGGSTLTGQVSVPLCPPPDGGGNSGDGGGG